MEELTMNTNTAFFVGLQSPAEVAVAWEAVEKYRQSPPQIKNNGTTPLLHIDAPTAVVAGPHL
jgi:hypothetical protein